METLHQDDIPSQEVRKDSQMNVGIRSFKVKRLTDCPKIFKRERVVFFTGKVSTNMCPDSERKLKDLEYRAQNKY